MLEQFFTQLQRPKIMLVGSNTSSNVQMLMILTYVVTLLTLRGYKFTDTRPVPSPAVHSYIVGDTEILY
jgi:hypothetical protein